jgi:uncharacterized protein YegL
MPKLTAAMTSQTITGSNFTFQATRIGDLGATEYTLATIAIDITGSVGGFEQELLTMLVTAIEACKRSPRSENLLVRVVEFNSSVGVRELHGFTPLVGINTAAYKPFRPAGMTPLFDATYNAIGAMIDYGKQLADNDFLANGIVFVITDGGDNDSTMTVANIRRQIETARQAEELESLVGVVIGINDSTLHGYLEDFRRDAGLDQYVAAGDATPGRLAKLAAFVSQSVSSQSQALGTGGPSQNISATI